MANLDSVCEYGVQISLISCHSTQILAHIVETCWFRQPEIMRQRDPVGEVKTSILKLFNIILYVTSGPRKLTAWWLEIFVILMAKRVQLYVCMHSSFQVSVYPELDFPATKPIAKIIHSEASQHYSRNE